MSSLNPYIDKSPVFFEEKREIKYDIDFSKNHIFDKQVGYTSDFLKAKYSSNQYPKTNIFIDCSDYCVLGSGFNFFIELIGQTIKYLEEKKNSILNELNELWDGILNSNKHEWHIKEDIFTFYKKLEFIPENIIYIVSDFHLIAKYITEAEFLILKRISVDKTIANFWFISEADNLVGKNDIENTFFNSFKHYPDFIQNQNTVIQNFIERISSYLSENDIQKLLKTESVIWNDKNFDKEKIKSIDNLELKLHVNYYKPSIRTLKQSKMEKIKIFISYAHADESLKDDLEKHLSGLRRGNIIDDWNDRKIMPGVEWDKEIKKKLNESQIVLFLVSKDFLFSDYINDVEVNNTLERYKRNEVIIVPIIIKPCDFSSLPIGKFQALPKDAKPINTWSNTDEAWLDAINGVKQVIKHLKQDGESLPDKIQEIKKSENYISQIGSNNINIGENKGTIIIKK